MPREQINYITVPVHDRADEEPTLHVNWDNDQGLVQVSLNMTTERYVRWAERLDPAVVSHTSQYTPILTRSEINRLIRVLRTARDKAYGKDE